MYEVSWNRRETDEADCGGLARNCLLQQLYQVDDEDTGEKRLPFLPDFNQLTRAGREHHEGVICHEPHSARRMSLLPLPVLAQINLMSRLHGHRLRLEVLISKV